jgi:hypothetical protein
MMDKEQQEAQDLTAEDLVGKLESGRPAELQRVRGVQLRPGGEPQERIVVIRQQSEPVRVKGSRSKTTTES